MSFYRIINHTADLGIAVTGENPSNLFQNAALAVTDLLTDTDRLHAEYTETVTITGLDFQDLLINWLREVLYFWNGKRVFAADIDISDISDTTLTACISLAAYDPNYHTIHREIKAVTYHQAEVIKKDGQWNARIIFDV
jgi:protein archease